MTEQQLEAHGAYLGFAGFVLLFVIVLAIAAVLEARKARRGGPLPPAFVCPDCGAQSWNPNDGEHGYCGRCHRHTGRPHGLDIPTDPRRVA